MAYTIDEVLNNPLVTIVERNDADRIYRIRLGELNQVITIRLKKSVIITGIEYSTSHVIKTPPQDAPYRTGSPFGDTPASALDKAIVDLTSYYRAAIKAGFSPSDDWLQPS
jgi:hypothetical protein